MILFVIALFLVCVYGMKIYGVKQFNREYLSRENTNAVKGVFVFLIFMSHFLQYYTSDGPFDGQYLAVRVFLGQLVVVMFWFYSGYGIYESVKRKGVTYIADFPKNRILKTLFHLDLALLFYIIRNLIMGVPMKLPDVLLSLFGWSTIGNSNWFMFVVLVLYLIVYVSFLLFRKNKGIALVTTTLFTVAYIVIMYNFSDKESYWYNTALCFPIGLWYSYFKERIEAFVMKNGIVYHIALIAVFALFMLTHFNKLPITVYIIWTVLFTLLVVLITMKLKIGNKVLYWLGNHVFSIYIFQRLPMSVFVRFENIASNRYLFFILSFVVTAIIAELFDRGVAALDKVIFDRKKKPAKQAS